MKPGSKTSELPMALLFAIGGLLVTFKVLTNSESDAVVKVLAATLALIPAIIPAVSYIRSRTLLKVNVRFPVSSGKKTSELGVALVIAVGGLLVTFGVLNSDEAEALIKLFTAVIMLAASSITTNEYINSRSQVKAAALEAENAQ